MSITLRQLRYVVAVHEERNFRLAAERCHVSQPALSQQILQLEAHCGAALFERLGRGVMTTPFGEDFVARARATLERADALEAFVHDAQGNPARPLRFGLIPTVAPYLLPTIYPLLRQEMGEVDLAISESRTESLLHDLGDGRLDLALIATEPPPGGPGLHVEPLFRDEFVLATGPDDSTAEPVRLAAIATERMLLLDEGHCFRDQAIAACRLQSERVARTFAATSLSTIVEFVANGQGITLLPRLALRKEATDPRIQVRRLEAPAAGRELVLVWRQSTPFGPLHKKIAQLIRTAHGAAD